MARTVTCAISLPRGLKDFIDEILIRFNISRSAFITAAVLDYLMDMGLLADCYLKVSPLLSSQP